MNKYLRAIVVIPNGFFKTLFLKIFHPTKFKGVQFAQISLSTEITLNGGTLRIGSGFKMRDGAKIRVRKNANLIIGKNVMVNSSNIIACRESIVIGDGVELSPGVQIYDHDHDFRVEGGIKAKKYKTSPVVIGKNVWIGCNSVILRGTIIGDNSVIGAGSVVKGIIEENSLVIQKRTTEEILLYGKTN